MSNVKFRPIETNLRAPDFTKAGSVFSAALNKIGAAAEQLRQNPINIAKDQLTGQIRDAETQEDLALLSTDFIQQRGGSVDEITAAENALTGRRVDIFGEDQAELFTVDRERNTNAIREVATANPELGVTLDAGGNPRFTSEANQAKFSELLRKTDFSPIRSTQDQTSFIRKRLTAIGGTEEDIQREITNNKTRRREISTLDENQQAQIAGIDAQIDSNVQLQLNQVDSKKEAKAINFGYTDPEATALLLTKKSDVFAEIDRRGGDEQSFIFFLINAGIEIKEQVSNMFAEDPGLKPWMVMEAFKQSINTDEGNESVWASEFEDNINNIRNDFNLQQKITSASQLDNDADLEKQTVINRGNITKSTALSRFRGTSGITDAQRNAQIFNNVLQQNTGQVAPQAQPSPVSSVVAPTTTAIVDPQVVTPLEIGGQVADNITGTIGESISLAAEVVPTLIRNDFNRATEFFSNIFSGNNSPAVEVATDVAEENLRTRASSPERAFTGNPNVGGANPEVAITERLAEEATIAEAATPEALRAADDAFTAGLKKAREDQSEKAKEKGEKAVTFVKDLVSNAWAALSNRVRSNSSPQMIAFLDGAEKETVPVASEADIRNEAETENPRAKLIRDTIASILDSVKGSGRPLTAAKQIEMLQLRLGLLIAENAPQDEIDSAIQMTNELILKIK